MDAASTYKRHHHAAIYLSLDRMPHQEEANGIDRKAFLGAKQGQPECNGCNHRDQRTRLDTMAVECQPRGKTRVVAVPAFPAQK